MTTQQSLTEKNLQAEIFSAPVVAGELARMWQHKRAEIAAIAKEIHARKPENLIFFGSGASYSALYSGYQAARRYLKLDVNLMLGPDLVSLPPATLGSGTVAIGASYSGKTMDTVNARDALVKRGVPFLTITRSLEAPLAHGAEWKLTYESIALFTSPAYLSMLLVVELCRLRGEWSPEVEGFEAALEKLPALIKSLEEASRKLGEANAAKFPDHRLLVLAGGAAYTLGYMMNFDMFGEFLKQYSAFLHYSEFRHGPLEIVKQGEPTMMFLLGNDATRPFGEAVLRFAERNGAPTLVFDAAELAPHAHPLLDGMILYNSQLWLLYYVACHRNIDLDKYIYMHVTPFADGDTHY